MLTTGSKVDILLLVWVDGWGEVSVVVAAEESEIRVGLLGISIRLASYFLGDSTPVVGLPHDLDLSCFWPVTMMRLM